jgi:hypothetical protein
MKKYLLLAVLVLLGACAQRVKLSNGECILAFGEAPNFTLREKEVICNNSQITIQSVSEIRAKTKTK